MPTAERTIVVRRPVDEVYRYLAEGHPGRVLEARTMKVEQVGGPGGRLPYVVLGPGGWKVYRSIVLEPGRRVALEARSGPMPISGEILLEPLADGTILTCSLRAEPTGWRRFVLAGATRDLLAGEMEALDGLRDLLEG